ncbi:hypothetical protein [Actinomadura sp. 3N508]|uniref:hypothetical protein n=1 Tax=Actinomadura sp. 3N508 TaxID=3375153 RepID=UPI0037B2289F
MTVQTLGPRGWAQRPSGLLIPAGTQTAVRGQPPQATAQGGVGETDAEQVQLGLFDS